MVLPSRTDTFGNVITESMACGAPVATCPATGPRDVMADGVSGALGHDPATAAQRAPECGREKAPEYAINFAWEAGAKIFRDSLTPAKLARRQVPVGQRTAGITSAAMVSIAGNTSAGSPE